MNKVNIKNRKGQNIVVITEGTDNQKGLAFIMHGLGGFKEQPQLQTISKTFLDKEYIAIRFDTTNTMGESDGKYEDATITNYYEDLEDVIEWAKQQEWYKEPFCLVGHSLGGICTALYAERHPDEIKALAPLSTVVSGELSIGDKEEEVEEWKRTGWKIRESKSRPGVIKKLKWSHMEDRLKYDLLEEVDNLTMPVLMMVGSDDDVTPEKHQRLLFNKLPGRKEIHVIKDAPHTFVDEEHLEEIREIFLKWIDSLE